MSAAGYKLKRCPFCGSPARMHVAGAGVFVDWYMAQVACKDDVCGATAGSVSGKSLRDIKRLAQLAWNRRRTPPGKP